MSEPRNLEADEPAKVRRAKDDALLSKLPKPSGHAWKDEHTDLVRRLIAQVWRETHDLRFDVERLGIATLQRDALKPLLDGVTRFADEAATLLQSVDIEPVEARRMLPVVIGLDLTRGRPNGTYPSLPQKVRRSRKRP